MNFQPVQNLLPAPLLPPELELLRPLGSYTCLLLQPAGPIYADKDRIGPLNQVDSLTKSRSFLSLASAQAVHLAVTPEYFLHWTALEEALTSGVAPPVGSIWALGCESTDEGFLAGFKKRLADVGISVLHEDVSALDKTHDLLDPMALVFQAPDGTGNHHLVCVVQFKTLASRDETFTEELLLRCGTTAWTFRSQQSDLRFAAIICSDAFALTEHQVSELVHRGTLLHIQLNPGVRNPKYRQYRTTAFSIDPDSSQCHVVCLNWATPISSYDAFKNSHDWKNYISGSAWYCSESRCSCDEPVIAPNHRKGLYYTYMQDDHRHALYLTYAECVLRLRVPKVVTGGPVHLANKNGPDATERYEWSSASSQWGPANSDADAGFSAALKENPDAAAALAPVLPTASITALERTLALSSGTIEGGKSIERASSIDSFRVRFDEVIKRVTFAQDPAGHEFRYQRIQAAADVRRLLDTAPDWPPQVKGLSPAATLIASDKEIFFNVKDQAGRPALVIAVQGDPSPARLADVTRRYVDLLGGASHENRERLCIVYRRYGQIVFHRLPFTRFDKDKFEATDFASVDLDEETS